jgi:hypothetical protein
MNLQDYPRPKDDNGIGLHFRLDLVETENKPHISQGVEWLQAVNAKWTLVAGQDWMQIGKAARLISDAGIMPVCRLVCKIDKPFIDWETGVKTLHDLGLPAYMQIFNEPGDSREWNNERPDIQRFGEKWADAAGRVLGAGGLPGMGGVLGQDEWLAAFDAVKEGGNTAIWDKAWFCVHNYGSNHPPNYPYDDVNQKGIPATSEEYSKYRFSMPFDELNTLRHDKSNPGDTIFDDDTAVLRVHVFKKWMIDSLGFCLPMIGGEGGWQWQTEEDLRYPKLPDEFHAAYTREMFEWFRHGKLSDGTPLMDELLCCTAWIQADGQADSWWFGPLGTKQGTIDAVASIPSFTRKFTWDAAPETPEGPIVITEPPVTGEPSRDSLPVEDAPPMDAPVASEPPRDTLPVEDPPLADAPPADMPAVDAPVAEMPPPPPSIAYVVQQGETLWGIAKKFGTTVDQIVAANEIADRNTIRAGQKLTIPR